MIVRSGRQFDGATLGRRAIGGQHALQNLVLLAHHEALILFAIALTFFHQCLDRRIAQVILVKPGNLREHLQVAIVALGEGDGGVGRLRPGGKHLLPQPR